MIRKYHNHKLQTTPWHREEEPLNHHETPGRHIKQSNQLSLPHQDDCNTFTFIFIFYLRFGVNKRYFFLHNHISFLLTIGSHPS